MTDTPSLPAAALLAEIKDFCAAQGMSHSAFGKKVLSDPSFVLDLEQGRDVRLSTMRKVRAFMAAPHPDDEAAA